MLRDLSPTTERFGTDRVVVTTALTEHLCDPSGFVAPEIPAILIDIAGAGIAINAVTPDWIATVDLAYHAIESAVPGSGDLTVTATPLRIGRRLVVIEAAVTVTSNGLERRVGHGELTFSRIPSTALRVPIPISAASGPTTLAPTQPLDQPLRARIGATFDADTATLHAEHGPYIANSFGTINGGVVAGLLAQAAQIAAGGNRVVTDLHVRHLAQSKGGTVTATTTDLRVTDNARATRNQLITTDGELLATGIVHCAPPDRS